MVELQIAYPGSLGAQATYFVGTLKDGVGRIDQPTFMDTYSRIALATLDTEKTAITAADMLHDMVLPWSNDQAIP